MKISLLLTSLALTLLAFTSNATADLLNDDYFISPGLNNGTEDFLPAGITENPATFDMISHVLGTGFGGGTVSVSESFTGSSTNPETIQILLATTGSDMFLTQETGSTARLFLGDGTPGSGLAVEPSPLLLLINGATATFRNAANALVGGTPVDIYNDVDGGSGWDGTLDLDFGNSFVNAGVTSVELNFTTPVAVPEPGTMGLLTLLGLGWVHRRRRR